MDYVVQKSALKMATVEKLFLHDCRFKQTGLISISNSLVNLRVSRFFKE